MCWAEYHDYTFGSHDDRESFSMSQLDYSCELVSHESDVDNHTDSMRRSAPGCDFDACLEAARTGYEPYNRFLDSSVASWECEQGSCTTARQFCREWVRIVGSVCPSTCHIRGSGVVPLHSEPFPTREAAESACLAHPESCKGIYSEAVPNDLCAPSATCGPFISEYQISDCNYERCTHFFEVYNPTSATVDLGLYAFPQSNAFADETSNLPDAWNTFEVGATIAPGGVYVVCHPSFVSSRCDQMHEFASSGSGGQCLVIGNRTSYSSVDCVGDVSPTDPGHGWDPCGISAATGNFTLMRKCGVSSGNAGNRTVGMSMDSCDWTVAPDTVSHGNLQKYWDAGGSATHVCSKVWRMSPFSTLVTSQYTWSSLCRSDACSRRIAALPDRHMPSSFADGTDAVAILSSCCQSDADCDIGQTCSTNVGVCLLDHTKSYDVRSVIAEECQAPSILYGCQVDLHCSTQLDHISSCGSSSDKATALAPPKASELRCARQENAVPFPHNEMGTPCQVCEDYNDQGSCLACCAQIRESEALSHCCHGECCALAEGRLNSTSAESHCPADSPGISQFNRLMQCVIEMPNNLNRIADPVRDTKLPLAHSANDTVELHIANNNMFTC